MTVLLFEITFAHTHIFHICHSSVDQISRPTNSPHMAPCIGTCFLGYYDVYTHFPCWIRVDSGRGQQRAPHYASPCSLVIQTLRPPLVWLQEMDRGPVSVSSDRQIGAISIRTQVAEWVALFRSACWNRIHPLQGSLEGRRRTWEMKCAPVALTSACVLFWRWIVLFPVCKYCFFSPGFPAFASNFIGPCEAISIQTSEVSYLVWSPVWK